MPRLLTTLCLILTAASLATASSLEQLQTSFMSRYDEANAERDQNLRKLEASYLGALQRHMDKVKASGKLERVIPVRDEIEAIETGADPLPELPERADSNLKKMRQQYLDARGKVRQSHAETLVKLADTMDQALQKEEADLTRAGKIDEALSAKRMRETLSEDQGIATARHVLAINQATARASGEWKNLLDADTKQTRENKYFAGRPDQIPDGAMVFAPLLEVLRQRKEKPSTILMAHAPATFEFTLDQHVTQLQGATFLGNGSGNAIFRIRADDKLVFEKEVSSAGDEAFKVEFKPTRKIVLEIDTNGSNDRDWCAWLRPEYR